MSHPASAENIQLAGDVLRAGGLVAIPTETVYGLAANALDEVAVRNIFCAKGRPSDNPLIVHVADLESAARLVSDFDPISLALAKAFWPGPLTIVLPLSPSGGIAPSVSAGLTTVGIRVPQHPVALAVLRAAGVPLAAPSANKSGSPSPTCAEHVLADLADWFPKMVLDGGACKVGLESTVVQVFLGGGNSVHILRPGGIAAEQLRAVLTNDVEILHNTGEVNSQPRAPGMKYRHYAPTARVIPVMSSQAWVSLQPTLLPDNVVVICFDTLQVSFQKKLSFASSPTDIHTASARLFDLLRIADTMGARNIYIDCTFDRETGMGVALWNRISKASDS